jgi:26S proteasome regulatory subunit N13
MSSNPSSVVQDLLRSLQGNQSIQSNAQDKPFTTLTDLLAPASTLPLVESADLNVVDHLLSFLPPSLLILSLENDNTTQSDTGPEVAATVMSDLSLKQKKDILQRVLRSPQFTQSLGSFTVALTDGGLPSISEALNIKVDNGGFMRRGGVPLGGGDAVEAFLEGVKKQVAETSSGRGEDRMQTE